ncbi:MAG: glutathione S-transferase family protein [Paracoccaceae bacterium]
MGRLVDGIWHTDEALAIGRDGRFHRTDAPFRNWITPDGAPGPSGEGGFAAESGRYHLYVSYACPWAHRTLIFRKLKALEDHIGVSVVHPLILDQGWTFATDFDGTTGDVLAGRAYLHEVYTAANPGFSGRVSVPALWDRKRNTIVSNESSEIIRMFNAAFDGITGNTLDFYPEALRADIDAVNERVYNTLNNGVYRCGFARTQEAYDEAVAELFATLDWLEERLGGSRYLVGDRITEADWRLAVTLFRFETVYHFHFKCTRNRLRDFANLWAYARELYQWPGIAETVRQDHIVNHYYRSHESINPFRIVPAGPRIDWNEPHGRGDLVDAA